MLRAVLTDRISQFRCAVGSSFGHSVPLICLSSCRSVCLCLPVCRLHDCIHYASRSYSHRLSLSQEIGTDTCSRSNYRQLPALILLLIHHPHDRAKTTKRGVEPAKQQRLVTHSRVNTMASRCHSSAPRSSLISSQRSSSPISDCHSKVE